MALTGRAAPDTAEEEVVVVVEEVADGIFVTRAAPADKARTGLLLTVPTLELAVVDEVADDCPDTAKVLPSPTLPLLLPP